MNLPDEAIATMVRTYEADALGPFDTLERRCTAMRAALEAAAPFLVPEGWVMVPKEPTEEMILAGMLEVALRFTDEGLYRPRVVRAYRAMLALPPPPSRQG